MAWMEPRAAERSAPPLLWPDVRSVVMLGMNYSPDTDPMARLQQRSKGVVSVYAQGRDYHDVIKPRLKEIAALLGSQNHQAKVFVDTAPVMEKTPGAKCRTRLAGKAHRSRQPRFWLMAIFGCSLHRRRFARGCAGAEPLRLLYEMSRYLPDTGVSCALSA